MAIFSFSENLNAAIRMKQINGNATTKNFVHHIFLEHGSYVLPVDQKTTTFLCKSQVFTKAHWLSIISFCAKLLGNKKWLKF